MQWQPIETVPDKIKRDGQEILLAWPNLSRWVVTAGHWQADWHGDHTGACWLGANLDEEYGLPLNPTHWMPLPPPPGGADE